MLIGLSNSHNHLRGAKPVCLGCRKVASVHLVCLNSFMEPASDRHSRCLPKTKSARWGVKQHENARWSTSEEQRKRQVLREGGGNQQLDFDPPGGMCQRSAEFLWCCSWGNTIRRVWGCSLAAAAPPQPRWEGDSVCYLRGVLQTPQGSHGLFFFQNNGPDAVFLGIPNYLGEGGGLV